jgi:hypothetical protein
LVQGGKEVFAFAPLQLWFGEDFRLAARRFSRRKGRRGISYWQVKVERAAARNNDSTFDHIPQFSDVAGPVVTLKFGDARPC